MEEDTLNEDEVSNCSLEDQNERFVNEQNERVLEEVPQQTTVPNPVIPNPSTSTDTRTIIPKKKRRVEFKETPSEKLMRQQVATSEEQSKTMKLILAELQKQNDTETQKLELIQKQIDSPFILLQ
jgi:hypothetical protein